MHNTKTIAFIINVFRENNFHSGGEKLYYELVKNAIQDGFIVDLYCCKYLTLNEEPELKLNKLTVMGNAKDYKYPEKIEALFEKYKELTKAETYDYIIAENITPPMDMAILQGHSHVHYKKMAGNSFSQLLYGLKKQKFIQYQKKWLKEGYRKIFVPSRTLQNELMENFNIPEEKFVIVYPGVDMPKEVKEINSEKPLTLGLSAPSFEKKGGYIFLKALKLLKDEGYSLNAKIIYPKVSKNLALLAHLKLYGLQNMVEFLPHQSNMSDFYNSVDCIVMPSLMETFGLIATEAMAHRRIPIVGSFCGASEVIEDGENGFVFAMQNNPAQNLAGKVEFLLKNPEEIEKLANRAYTKAQTLSWKNTYKAFIENL